MPADPGDYLRFPDFDPATAAGIGVAIAGNILISLALNLQKLAHRRLEPERNTPSPNTRTPDRDVLRNITEGDEAQSDPSTLDLAVEPNPWNRSYASLHNLSTSVHTPYSERETEPLTHANGAQTPMSYGAATPARERSQERPRVRRKERSSRLVNLVDWSEPEESEPEQDSESEGHSKEGGPEKSYLRSRLWWAGFLLMNLGEVGNFISYGFAPASVVAPLGTFALVANCFFAPLIQHEKFRKRDLLGVAVAIIGAVTVVLSAHTSDTRLTPAQIVAAVSRTPFLIFAAIYIVAAVIFTTLSHKPIGDRFVLVDVGLCALFGGFTVLATKGVSTLLTTRGLLMFKEWISYPIIAVLIGTGIGQIRYLNRALMRFDSKVVIPAQFVLFNLSAILGSAILYQDFSKTSFHAFVTFLYGCAATFAGVFIIASDSGASETSGRSEGEEEHAGGGDEGGAARIYVGEPGSVRKVHVIRPRDSVVSLVGLSPAQGLLLVHTPPFEDPPILGHHGRDVERGDGLRRQQRRPESMGRRRGIPVLLAGRETVQGVQVVGGTSASLGSVRSDGTHA